MYGWLALACSFTPVILIYCLDEKPTQMMLINTMVIGLVSMLIWRFMGYGEMIYEAGIVIPCAIIYYLLHKFYLNFF